MSSGPPAKGEERAPCEGAERPPGEREDGLSIGHYVAIEYYNYWSTA